MLPSLMVRHHIGGNRWEGVDVHPYKEDGGTHFKSITRQTLFGGAHDLGVELRYFEIGEGGHSTLERHEHAHLVVINEGCGEVMVGDKISQVGLHDVVHVPPMTWHQFRATQGQPLGFLCVVSALRDRPQRPGDLDLASFSDEARAFVRT
ncbi:MAG: cupin domain-containing protein [Armatimonadetes bacterium]|nr:cupin domain-containing protein [Armatimonadota bacterium]